MKPRVRRAGKHVGYRAAQNRADNSEYDGPDERDVDVHDRFGDHARDQPD